MGEQLSEANRALIERVLGEMVGTTTVREAINSFPNMFGRIFDAARAEGPHTEQNAKTAHCSSPGESWGWVMVPREPTEAMNDAAKPFRKGVGENATHLWARMIAAAPPLEGVGRPEDGSSQGLGGHPCGERDGAETEQAAALAWDDHEDEISDAISDSIDMDWTSRDGAKAVVRFLNTISKGAVQC